MDCLLVRVNNHLSRTSGQALFRTLHGLNSDSVSEHSQPQYPVRYPVGVCLVNGLWAGSKKKLLAYSSLVGYG